MADESRIVLIGNGFDLHHGLKSRYCHYKEWLKITHPYLLQKLERYIDVEGEWWGDFESNLAKFDIWKLIKECPRTNPPRAPRVPPSPSYPANGFFKKLRCEITDSFVEWVKTLSLKDFRKRVDLPEAKLYVSFNYTDTLEQVYGIPEERILYIHGKAVRGDNLIFGHCKSDYEIKWDYMRKQGLREPDGLFDTGSVISDEESELALVVSFLDKYPYTQIARYSDIIEPAFVSSKEVVCFGLSFSEVDYQYLEWIAVQNPNLRWRVSWHSLEDKKRVLSFFSQEGIKDYSLFKF